MSWQVTSSIIESYIQHASINENFAQVQKDQHLLTLGQINVLTQESLDLKLALVLVGVNNLLDLQIAAIPPQIEDLFSTLPNLNLFEDLERPEYCNDALFFDTLVHCVRNSALLQQKKIFTLYLRGLLGCVIICMYSTYTNSSIYTVVLLLHRVQYMAYPG